MTFQDRLYRLRKERGISQEELSHIVGVSRQAVQKWESGASRPDMDNLAAIARYFGVTLDYLITGGEAAPAGPVTVRTVCLPGWRYEYKSRAALFGLPLLHVNMGDRGVYWARGVIAVGNFATGLFAFGGVSAGVVSLRCLSAGGLALGALGVGVVALGGLAAGVLAAFGGVALSFGLAVGGCAVGGAWAMGGAAYAGQVAAGGAAAAPIAIGDAVEGAVTFPKDAWGPGTTEAVRAAIRQMYPGTPEFIVKLFGAFH